MSFPRPQPSVEFWRVALQSGGWRIGKGLTGRRGSKILIQCLDQSTLRVFGEFSVRPNSLDVLVPALEAALSGQTFGQRTKRRFGTVRGDRTEHDVWVCQASRSREAALCIGRRMRDGAFVGRPLTFSGEELHGLKRAVDWLMTQESASEMRDC